MTLSPLKQNILANYLGNAWAAVMSLVFIPLYLHFLGIEAYGLVGLFATLQAMSFLLDLGLSNTLNRELARLSVHPDKPGEMGQLVRTLEVIYWAVAAVIGLTVLLLAPFLAHHWVHPERLTPATVQQAFLIMGLALACQWPLGFYSGGLMGLQRQVLLNVINIITATLRGAGAVLLLWLVSPTIQAFFIWQAAVGALQTLAVGWWLWRILPAGGPPPRFHPQVLRGVWRFAAGMSGISVLGLILFNMDKIILSKLLTLEMLGYYMLAWAAAAAPFRLVAPIFIAMFPRFTQLVSLGDLAGLTKLYHRTCQLVSVLILPAALMVALFSRELLLLWTRNPVTVEHTHLLLSLLTIGMALNALENLPYALQLAYGWTKLVFFTNIAAILLLAPSLIFLALHYGAVGAAAVWVILNAGYVLTILQFMHRRLLQGEKWRWYVRDVSFPLGVSLAVTALGHWFMPHQLKSWWLAVYLLAIWLAATLAAILTTPQLRGQLVSYLPYGRRNLWKAAGIP
jgi:O-antigen/teichoic acid export membrane protein